MMVTEMDDLTRFGTDLEAAADEKTVFASGMVVGAFVPLVVLAFG